jgi:hypothetical protein
MKSRNPSITRCFAISILMLSCASVAWASPSNKWRIEVSGGANSDGTLTLAVAPVGQESVTVEIPLSDGKGENAVASTISKVLKEKLGKAFKVEVDDGEDVLVKKRGSTPDFEITLVDSTVKGVRLRLQHE